MHCPKLFHIDSAASCSRFYRDHCLHGLAVSNSPGRPKINRCVESIERLGRCAAKERKLSECDDVSSSNDEITTVCGLVAEPQAMPDCAFLEPDPGEDEEEGGAGAGGESGGSGSGDDAGSGGKD